MTLSFGELHPAVFDSVARDYDDQFTYSAVGRSQREQIWAIADQLFTNGERLLEIGCGTGYDALHFAERGCTVLACDQSPEMIRVATQRVHDKVMESKIALAVCSNEELHLLHAGETFDGVFSNFGSLNCSPNLEAVAAALATKVPAQGRLLLCLIGPFSLWEFVWYIAKGKPGKALRRLNPRGARTYLGGQELRVFYPSIRKLRKLFAPAFVLKQCWGIGIAVPPSYIDHLFSTRPKLLKLLSCFDNKVQQLPLVRSLGDHILLEFAREEA